MTKWEVAKRSAQYEYHSNEAIHDVAVLLLGRRW